MDSEPQQIPALSLGALAAVCIVIQGLVWFWEPFYLILSVDDTYYYVKTAINIAQGHGSTFDRVNPTNGYHPLWMIPLVAMASVVGDSIELLMRLVLCVQVILIYEGTMRIGRWLPLGGGFVPLVAALLLSNFYVLKSLVNGQESALQYFLLCWTLAYWGSRHTSLLGRGYVHAALLGCLAGLTALCRLDASVFALVVLAMPIIWPGPDESSTPVLSRLYTCAVSFLVFAGLLCSYFVFNIASYGHPAPISGAVKVWMSQPFWPAAAGYLAVVLCLLVVYWQISKRYLAHTDIGLTLRILFPLVVYCSAESVSSFWMTRSFFPPLWYLPPFLLLCFLSLSAAIRLSLESGWGRRATYVGAALLICVALFTWIHRTDERSYKYLLAYRAAAQWLSRNTDVDALVAGWDVGIIGAHSGRRVMNLDGLANSWDYKERFLEKKRESDFINHEKKVDYVCQRVLPGQVTSPVLRGVDLSRFYVAHFECTRHLYLSNFLNPASARDYTAPSDYLFREFPHYVFILSREPTKTGITYAEFLARCGRSLQTRCPERPCWNSETP